MKITERSVSKQGYLQLRLHWQTMSAQAVEPSDINNSSLLDNMRPHPGNLTRRTSLRQIIDKLPFKENDVCVGLISIIADSCLVEEFSKPKGLNQKESRLYTAVTAV